MGGNDQEGITLGEGFAYIAQDTGGRGVSTAYTIGYMKALLQRANEEVAKQVER